jgi:23S rRNA (guanosine2251-2'-O)-methyltransferase
VIVYGRNAVKEALRGKRAVTQVWADRNGIAEPWLRRVDVTEVDSRKLEELAGSPDHQGVAAEAGDYPYADAASLLEAEDALVVVLDEVTDPRNLGAVARVAECAGAAGLVIPERRAAHVTPVVCKTSAGAVEHLPIAQVRNVSDYLESVKGGSTWVYGADAGGQPYDSFDYSGRKILVLGAEGRGLRPRVAKTCDALVALPIRGHVDSLNVSAAAAALVYGILHSAAAS